MSEVSFPCLWFNVEYHRLGCRSVVSCLLIGDYLFSIKLNQLDSWLCWIIKLVAISKMSVSCVVWFYINDCLCDIRSCWNNCVALYSFSFLIAWRECSNGTFEESDCQLCRKWQRCSLLWQFCFRPLQWFEPQICDNCSFQSPIMVLLHLCKCRY